MLASELAKALGGVLDGRDVEIVACAGLEEARKGDLSFCKDPKHAALVHSTKASAVLLTKDWAHGAPCPVIVVKSPDEACIKAATMLAPPPPVREPGVHPTAVVDPTARLGRNVHVGALAVIERNAEIGDGCVIEAQSFIGESCRLGEGCHVYPQVTVREGCVLGKKVILHCGVRVGGDGYGYTTSVGLTGIKIEKIPQLGIVELGDGVEVGSNTTIDRARIGRTYIGPQTKIDNLVQVGHNVKIAGYSGLIAQSGVAGSTQIGKGCLVWAQAGVSGHIKIADGVQVGPQAGVSKSLDGSVKYVIGAPAESKKEFGSRLLLPRIVEKLKAEVKALRAQLEER